MKISAIRSDKVYSKIMNAPLDKKNDIYRYELMKPFEKKWACYSVPMKALTPDWNLSKNLWRKKHDSKAPYDSVSCDCKGCGR